MAKAYAMIANGTEEVECLAVVDVLRRAGIRTVLVSVETPTVIGSHSIALVSDAVIGEIDMSDADLIFLPGGMPGSKNLAACAPLVSAVAEQLRQGKLVAAICAAPAVVLGTNNLLRGKKATCYPGFENGLLGANPLPKERVVTDGNVVTARGLGCAFELGLELVRLLTDEKTADNIKSAIQFR